MIGWGIRGRSKNTIYQLNRSEDFLKEQIIEKIKKYNTDKYDVYITVDQDFSGGGKTKYNYDRTPEYKQEDGRNLVIKVLENLGNADIVGFDVTGLPALENNNPNYKIDKAAFETALKDIDVFQTKAGAVLN